MLGRMMINSHLLLHPSVGDKLPAPQWIVVLYLLLAGAKILAGCVGFIFARRLPNQVSVNQWHIALVLAFSFMALILLFAGKRDIRAVHLGAVFLLIASAFAQAGVERLLYLPPGFLMHSGRILSHLSVDAFVSFSFWLFIQNFPRAATNFRTERLVLQTTHAALVIGAVLFLLNCLLLAVPLAPHSDAMVRILRFFQRDDPSSYYWFILFVITMPAVPFVLWKTRLARINERRRVRIFIGAILIGTVPFMLEVILEALIPQYREFMKQPSVWKIGELVFFPLLLSIPVLTSYSVLVDHVLDVRLIIRKAVQYVLARSLLVAAASTPALLLMLYVYRRRDQTIATLFSHPDPLWLGAAIILGLVVLRYRDALFDSLDRRFFREHYDARQILTRLADQCKGAVNLEEMKIALTSEVNKALHLEFFMVLVADSYRSTIVALGGRLRDLPFHAELVSHLETTREPLEISLEDESSVVRRLPFEEQQWLADGGLRLLVPLIASNGKLLGLLAAGEKKSELPFSKEDKLLLQAIASSAALTLELRENKELAAEISPAEAFECIRCRRIYPAALQLCEDCGGDLAKAVVPHILMGKFRLERRIGAGGMGVVYSAIDLALDRQVAIKTLPMASPQRSFRLRREGRAIASVRHPNLALIFGIETWRGVPMLVFEFMEGGTLADRLARAPLPIQKALALGIMLAEVLDYLHSQGMLHRDIKPGNIGYQTPGDIPKLMDFGLVQILHETLQESRQANPRTTDSVLEETSTASTQSFFSQSHAGPLIGTPAYLSPEAIQGDPPNPSFDLWSAAVVLYESLAGTNPLSRKTIRETLSCIVTEPVPDIRELAPECPDGIAVLLKEALSKDPRQRPGTGRQLSARLRDLQLLS
jgi:tRNA A-37 threonylcarbamoyl transferase component Bud32